MLNFFINLNVLFINIKIDDVKPAFHDCSIYKKKGLNNPRYYGSGPPGPPGGFKTITITTTATTAQIAIIIQKRGFFINGSDILKSLVNCLDDLLLHMQYK